MNIITSILIHVLSAGTLAKIIVRLLEAAAQQTSNTIDDDLVMIVRQRLETSYEDMARIRPSSHDDGMR